MNKILNVEQAIESSNNFHKQGKKIVLVGGCFDLLHLGHILFLEKAKQQGDLLFVLLESDEKIKRIKGKNRPINSQKNRALILAALKMVDYIVLLPEMTSDQNYQSLISKLKPHIIAITIGDPYRDRKEAQARLIKAKVVEVTNLVSDKSTSQLAKLIAKNL